MISLNMTFELHIQIWFTVLLLNFTDNSRYYHSLNHLSHLLSIKDLNSDMD
jgi:hypothetical protein